MKDFQWPSLLEKFGEVLVRVGQGPYPLQQMTLRDYHQRMMMNESLDEPIGNIFQFGSPPTSFTRHGNKEPCCPAYAVIPPFGAALHEEARVACALTSMFHIPSFLEGSAFMMHTGLLIGPSRSGITFHRHADAVNFLVSGGAKRWWMVLPAGTVVGDVGQATDEMKPADDSGRLPVRTVLASEFCSSRQLSAWQAEAAFMVDCDDDHLKASLAAHTDLVVVEFEQQAGQIVYIPQGVQHAVVNLSPSIAVQMQWDRNHWRRPSFLDNLPPLQLPADSPDFGVCSGA